MAKDKKIFEIIKQIIRWIWRVALLLFFVFCIVFQAPLKVLTLVAIFLLACTTLPLCYRKWFWAGVGVVVLVLILWVFIPEKDGDWKLFICDKELAALEAKYKIPDEENAAGIYNQLLADYNKNTFEPNCLNNKDIDSETSRTYWHSKDYPEVAEWINGHRETIEKLMQASKFEKCKFNITSKSPFFLDIDKTRAFRPWAQLLSRASNNDIAEGRIKQGLGKIHCTLQIGKHLCQQPLLVDMLTGMSIKNIAIEHFKDFVITGKANKKQLDVIKGLINGVTYDWQSDLPRVLDYERLFYKNILSLSYEVNTNGQLRITRDFSKAIRNLMPDEFNAIPPLNYFQKKLVKASSIIGWFFVPSTPQEFSRVFDAAYPKYDEKTDPNFDWSKGQNEFSLSTFKLNYKYFVERLNYISEPTYYSVHSIYLRMDSCKRGALLLIALRRYKDKNKVWPENLDEIKGLTKEENFVDPANGQSFVYKLTGDSFTLYSKGENGIDNGGRQYSCGEDKKGDDINIWPLKQCQKESSKETSGEPNDAQRD
jgi:hypothetical protein